jgi:hypothetical protein
VDRLEKDKEEVGRLQWFVKIAKMKNPDRILRLMGDKRQDISVKIRINDAGQNEKVPALVDRIAVLIEKYTSQKPVIG